MRLIHQLCFVFTLSVAGGNLMFAQKAQDAKPQLKLISFHFSNGLSNLSKDYSPDLFDNVMREEIPIYALNAGVSAQFNVSQKVALEAGFTLINQGFKFREIWQDDIQVPPDPDRVIISTYRHNFVSVPLNALFTLSDGTWRPFFKLGASLDYTRYRNIDSFTGDENVNAFNVGGLIGAGVEVKLSEGLFLGFSPEFRLNKAPSLYGSDQYFYSLGLVSQMKFVLDSKSS